MNRRDFLLTTAALAGAPALPQSTLEQPANAVRSIQRLFTSEIEDKPWFYDRQMWPHYLAMLAQNRFNRFNLSFGIGYDFLFRCPAWRRRSLFVVCAPCSNSAGHEKRWPAPQLICCTVH